jgi:hypothetical protein
MRELELLTTEEIGFLLDYKKAVDKYNKFIKVGHAESMVMVDTDSVFDFRGTILELIKNEIYYRVKESKLYKTEDINFLTAKIYFVLFNDIKVFEEFKEE